ncbi:hypothetical protein DVA67_026325 [Solirubrobacter sp. CPCC 204708]|uniref:Uncharacterized protein n=1 Tax=Solirubrobacter deserti TaxID=2282478 RepID=A0ABT4RF84_9ACTN|nr:hypothetical protein [Solirubrobacter deserti]MBE2319511.1 hypothetical protein [Solirubrobacter deserti]MDA0137202.1 hypothetical protein [Solirubrobacter deserti]
MTAARASGLVEARLGRPPQDALEAAVVLEAWAGVPAQQALETASACMPRTPAPPALSGTRPATPRRPPRMAAEGAALLATVSAIALWAAPLAAALGDGVVGRALTLALPLALGLHSALQARHLGRPSGLDGLRHRRAALIVGAVALVAGPAAVLGSAGALAGLLTVTWTSGSILLRRGWVAGYAAVVVGATPVMLADVPALAVVAAVATIATAAAACAIGTPRGRRAADEPRARRVRRAVVPGPWTRMAGAGLAGVGIGVLLVGDPSVGWAGGPAAALALLPSAVGGLWAGHALWRLADVFPQALSGVPACDGTGPSARRSVGTLAGAIGRLALTTVVGSLAVVLVAPGPGAGVLAGFGVVALAGVLVALLESLGRPVWATPAIAAGVAAELAVPVPFDGAALAAGGAVAVLLMAPAALVLLARPARTLATALWIP